MIKNIQGTPVAKVGMKVKVHQPNGVVVIGEVIEISNQVENLITKVRIAQADGFKDIDVEDLIVEAVEIVKVVVESNLFKMIWNFFSNLFRKKK